MLADAPRTCQLTKKQKGRSRHGEVFWMRYSMCVAARAACGSASPAASLLPALWDPEPVSQANLMAAMMLDKYNTL